MDCNSTEEELSPRTDLSSNDSRLALLRACALGVMPKFVRVLLAAPIPDKSKACLYKGSIATRTTHLDFRGTEGGS